MVAHKEDWKLFLDYVNDKPVFDKDAHYTKSVKKSLNPLTNKKPVTFQVAEEKLGIGPEEALRYIRVGVSQRQVKQLRNGYFSEKTLDLHGLTRQEARDQMGIFLANNLELRGFKIIHGKGYGSVGTQGVLKAEVFHFLKQYRRVLAFLSCPQTHGGTGAIFVLLSQR